MSAEVIKFNPVIVGDGFNFDPDELLEANKGQDYTRLVIIGEYPNGEIAIAGSANAGETFILMERAKLKLLGN